MFIRDSPAPLGGTERDYLESVHLGFDVYTWQSYSTGGCAARLFRVWLTSTVLRCCSMKYQTWELLSRRRNWKPLVVIVGCCPGWGLRMWGEGKRGKEREESREEREYEGHYRKRKGKEERWRWEGGWYRLNFLDNNNILVWSHSGNL